jgi:tetratricopeptide (TPR) repeat protein
MKKIISLFCILVLAFKFNAQPPTYDDLLILYADGNYAKLIKETTKYSEKDNTKNDAIVYLWMAKAQYKISFQADRDEDYKNAFKDCFNSIGKFVKKDKEGKLLEQHMDFIADVKKTLVESIQNELEAKDYRKAAGWVTKAYKINPNDLGAKYLEAACKFRNADKGGANQIWKETDKLLMKVTSDEAPKEVKKGEKSEPILIKFKDYSDEDKELFKLGIFETAECYISMKQVEKAKTLLGKVAQWFEGDEDFKAKYDAIVN